MADPNWDFKTYSEKGQGKSASQHYQCSSVEDIKAMTVGQMASPNCLLWLWATNPMLLEAIDVMAAWGFTFKTMGVWAKMTKRYVYGMDEPKQQFGGGYILRSASEPFLIGTIGRPKTTNSTRGAIIAAVREHSRKPEAAFTAAEQLMPHARRIELYSRATREGWDTAGHEVGKFDRPSS